MPDPTPHALWRPGVGLALWFSAPADDSDADVAVIAEPDVDALPSAIAARVRGRTLRRSFTLSMGAHADVTVASLTLGPPAAVSMLADLSPDIGAGDLRFYHYLWASLQRFVAAGAVVPAVSQAGDEWAVRWVPARSMGWRSWHANVVAAAPPVVLANGGVAAIDDAITEFVDVLCRAKLAGLQRDSFSSPVATALLDGAGWSSSITDPGAAMAAWAQWAKGIDAGQAQLVLRLCEPDINDDDPARAEVDPDAALWRLQVCRRTPDRPDEPVNLATDHPSDLDDLTTDIARAVKIFPPLRTAKQGRSSLDFFLLTETVSQLLADGARDLADAGIEVMLPRAITYVRPTLKIVGEERSVASNRDVKVGAGEMLDFQWQLALGSDTLTADELHSLAGQKGDLVQVRGRWVRADNAALVRAAQYIQAKQAVIDSGAEPPDMGELFDLVASHPSRLPVPLSSVDGMKWLDAVHRGEALRPEPVSPPPALHADLRDYQQRGLEWLHHLHQLAIGGVLADDMGLGKTIQVIALLCMDQQLCTDQQSPDDHSPGPTLVVCPMSVVGNWVREIHRFAPSLTVVVHHGPARTRDGEFVQAATAADVVVTTFALVARDRATVAAVPWHRLVVDEAQHVKNHLTAQARALRSIPAPHRIALTGTPVENRLEDLRAVIDLVNPGLLGSASTFKARYADPIERDGDTEVVERLRRITHPFILRRTKIDPTIIPDLPAKVETTVRANLTAEQSALYMAVLNDMMEILEQAKSVERKGIVLATLTRLKQICNHPAHYLADDSPIVHRNEHRSGKVELLADIVESVVGDGERALLFTQYAAFGSMLAPWLSTLIDAPVSFLHGGVPRRQRDQMVASFQSDDGPSLMVASLRAGGTGLNLTAANHVVHLDRWWNPAVENQATDRAYRIGQDKRVEVRKFVCVGTLEERIDSIIRSKQELSSLTVQSGEAWITDMSDDELFALMRLRDEDYVGIEGNRGVEGTKDIDQHTGWETGLSWQSRPGGERGE